VNLVEELIEHCLRSRLSKLVPAESEDLISGQLESSVFSHHLGVEARGGGLADGVVLLGRPPR